MCRRDWPCIPALALALACTVPDPHPAADAIHPPVATPPILFLGCEAVHLGPVCARRPDSSLSLWLEVPPAAQPVLELDGQPHDTTWQPAADGLRAVLHPPPSARVLTLRDPALGWRWSLTLRPAPVRPPELLAIDALLAERRHDDALAALADLRADTGLVAAEADKLRGDLAFRLGDHPAALHAYDDAFAGLRAAGQLHGASLVALTAGYICTVQAQDFACARRWLDRHAEIVAVLPAARMRHGLNTGLLADAQGDLRAAIRGFDQAAHDARALGQSTDLAAALLKLGAIRSRIGDSDGARTIYDELLALTDLSPRDRALALQSAAWLDLEARLRGDATADPTSRLNVGLALFDRGGVHADASVAAEIRLNLTLAALLRDDPAAARLVLAPLVPPDRRVARWRVLLLGRVALAESDPANALRHFDEAASLADAAGDDWLAWQAAVLAGEALEHLGHDELALDRYRRAVALHSLRLGALSADGGREKLALDGDRGARRLVQLLLRRDRIPEAACVARTARAQTFAALAAATRNLAALTAHRRRRNELTAAIEQTWQRPARVAEQERLHLRAQLRRLDADLDAALLGPVPKDMPSSPEANCAAPPPGVLLLVYFPQDRGHVGFALDATTTVAAALPDAPADELAARLLAPFAAQIDRATEIRVLASGSLAAVAVHALPWRGRPLLAAAPVTYSLDLPREPSTPPPPRVALQLAPVSNLPGADAELAAAATALTTRGVTLTRLAGNEPDVRDRLGVDLLHYAGHARGDGWASALDLGGDRSLTTGDLLGGPAPTIAVLAGCETGLPDPRAHAGGMSLAHALLLAGSTAVVATEARVDDRLTAVLMPDLLTALADGLSPQLALRQVQLAHAAEPGWDRFRVYVP